jgi:hypothetical protein
MRHGEETSMCCYIAILSLPMVRENPPDHVVKLALVQGTWKFEIRKTNATLTRI